MTDPEWAGPMNALYRAGETQASFPTLSELWDRYVDEHKISICETTLSTDYRQATNWIRACSVQDVTEGRAIIIAILERKPLQSARKVVMFVRSMYRWATSQGVEILPFNPVQNFKMPKAPQKEAEIRIIPLDEWPIVLDALRGKGHHRAINWALFAEAMGQGAFRTGEVRGMKWADIDDGRILIHANYTLTHGYKNSTKTNKSRYVPINERLQQIFDELPRESEYIFPWSRQAFQSFFRRKMESLHENKLIKHRYRPYHVRHLAISRWLENGIPVHQCAQWAGNTSEVIWKFYASSTKEYAMPVI